MFTLFLSLFLKLKKNLVMYDIQTFIITPRKIECQI